VYPSLKDLKSAICSNQIANCPVTVEDIDKQIWGKDVAALKVKTTQKRIKAVSGTEMKVPKEYLSLHKEVYLAIDIFFVVCTSSTHLSYRKLESIYKAFK